MPRSTTLRALFAVLLLPAAACEFPKDPRGSLERVTGDTLRVGVTEAPPWVERRGDEAAGVEPELLRRFARSIGAEISWHWGSAAEHMEALAKYELDVVAGGFERATPWRKHVGLTAPFHRTRFLIAAPAGAPPPTKESVEDRPVAVQPGGPVAAWVREKGARPRPVQDLARAGDLVAAPDWRLRELGRDTLGVELKAHRHVMAVPPGENRLLMALEDALHGADVGAMLDERRGGSP